MSSQNPVISQADLAAVLINSVFRIFHTLTLGHIDNHNLLVGKPLCCLERMTIFVCILGVTLTAVPAWQTFLQTRFH